MFRGAVVMHTQRGEPNAWSKGRVARLLRALALVAAPFSQLNAGYAQQATPELPTEPILRIEAGQHGAQIRRIDIDAANKFAVTASEDKTVRVWSLPDVRLQRIIRLPIDDGDVGKAYAVAISPDGSTIAVGGITAAAGDNPIVLFDRASGALKQRLSNLPSEINHLAYSADGRRLAASLSSNGIRVFDALNGYQLLPSDTQYGDASVWAHFDRAGQLVTTSFDGFVRLYAANQYATPIARFEWKNHRPYSAVFSPDGTRVAVGDADTHVVVVLSGSDLTEQFKADTSGIPDNLGMVAVAWSQDGHFLYAGGLWNFNNVWKVRRWSNGGRGAYVDISAAPFTILELVGLKSGHILVLSMKGVGLIGPDAKVSKLQGYGALDLRSGSGHLLSVSADGGIVQVDAWEPRHAYRFVLAERVIKIDPPPDDSLRAPITRSPGLDVTNWDSSWQPAVNGAPIKLAPHELARSIAIVPGTQRFALGADYRLRMLDQLGHLVWPNEQLVPGTVWHVNVTSNQRLVVAAYQDGTVRWHRLSDGKELLALFIHPDGQRWIVWTPQGYYDASLGADELIGWHVNHGNDRAPDFYPVSQFRDRFYRPDVIQRVLNTPNLDVEEAVRDADKAAGRPTTKAVSVNSLLTPVVVINDPKEPAAVDRPELHLVYSVQVPFPGDSLTVEARIDGVKATAVDQRLVDTGSTRAGILNLAIPRRDSVVSVIAFNANGASEPATVHVKWRGPGVDPKLKLYVLAIGISNYKNQDKNKDLELHFAAKDADDFIALARTQAGGLYEEVIIHPPHGSLRDSEATKDAILDELDWISRAVSNTNDIAMIFLSGHGMKTPDQNYRFLPYDYDPDRIPRTTISDFELRDYLAKIGGKTIFFFDTCYSGNVLQGSKAPDTRPDVDKFANELRSAENGIIVFTSSTGNELSREVDGNGAFAKAVVEGMRGKAGRPEVPVVTITDLQGYVSRRVKELTNGNQKPMMAMPKTVEDFPVSVRLQ
jgi:WD40 repeat protein